MLLWLVILRALFGVPLPLVVVVAAAVVRNRTLLLYRGNLLAALVLGFDPKILLVVKVVVAVRRASKAEE